MRHAIAIAAGIELAWAAPAQAASSFEDLQFVVDLLNQVLERQPIGIVVPWRNAATGHEGMIKVTSTAFRPDGTPCRTYERTFVLDGIERTLAGEACRTPQGFWRLQSETDIRTRMVATGAPSAADTQRYLAASGDYTGPIDGEMSPALATAIRAHHARTDPAFAGDEIERRLSGTVGERRTAMVSGGGTNVRALVADADAAAARGDSNAAFTHYLAAANAGDAQSAYKVARMYHAGTPVPADLPAALGWYVKAANAGVAAAHAGVGYMHYRGVGGVAKNDRTAFQSFLAAAKGGVSGAMYRVGYMYERGEGVGVNPREARSWYVAAATKGHPTARQRVRDLGVPATSDAFRAPEEPLGQLGELPPLSLPGLIEPAPRAAAAPAAAPPPPQWREAPPPLPQAPAPSCGGGLAGALSCR
jgi:hypothetical protein